MHNAMMGVCGKSFYRYLRERRMWAARRMLVESDKLIKQVALDCGFRHFGRFTEQYVELFGEQPSDTRRRRGEVDWIENTTARPGAGRSTTKSHG
ncbi:MAG: AraC family transcriptional regulator [Hyphomicrobiales bacterium]|nr:AraC family transcriptional regulator [Hyphomicrobiales bacterium]